MQMSILSKAGEPIVTDTIFTITINQKCLMTTKLNTKMTANTIINLIIV